MLNYFLLCLFFIMFIFYQVGFVINEELFVFLSFFCFLEFFIKTIIGSISNSLDQRSDRIYFDLLKSQEFLFKTLITSVFYYSKILEIKKFAKEFVLPVYNELYLLNLVYKIDFFYANIHKNFYTYTFFLDFKAIISRNLVATSFLSNFRKFINNLFVVYHLVKLQNIPALPLFAFSISN